MDKYWVLLEATAYDSKKGDSIVWNGIFGIELDEKSLTEFLGRVSQLNRINIHKGRKCLYATFLEMFPCVVFSSDLLFHLTDVHGNVAGEAVMEEGVAIAFISQEIEEEYSFRGNTLQNGDIHCMVGENSLAWKGFIRLKDREFGFGTNELDVTVLDWVEQSLPLEGQPF